MVSKKRGKSYKANKAKEAVRNQRKKKEIKEDDEEWEGKGYNPEGLSNSRNKKI